MIERLHHVAMVRRLLSEQPVVALLGAAGRPELRGLDSLDVIHAGQDTFPLARKIRAVSLSRLGEAG